MKTLNQVAKAVARTGLEMGAIKINPEKPFTWASGAIMPIYNNNRLFLGNPNAWGMVLDGLAMLIMKRDLKFKVIAGTSTAGIPHAAVLARQFGTKMMYVRDKPKDHGLKTEIEGIDPEKGLNGEQVILIEDLISTGKSSVRAVQTIRDAGGICDHCFSIFDYRFEKARKMFQGYEEFRELGSPKALVTACQIDSLLSYEVLIETAREGGYIKKESLEMLEGWRSDPFGWWEKKKELQK